MWKKIKATTPLAVLMLLFAANAFAAGNDSGNTFVWDDLLEALSDSFLGVVAFAGGTMALVVAGLHWAFGDSDRAGRKVGVAVVAVAIALGAGVLIEQIIDVTGAVL